MPTSRHLISVKYALLGGLVATSLVVCTGCPTGADISGLPAPPDPTTVTIRLINQTNDLTEELDVRIDGDLRTFTCTAEEGISNTVLEAFPSLVEAVEERRFDAMGGYRGGRDFEGEDEFTLTRADFEPGSIIVFRLSELAAAVSVR